MCINIKMTVATLLRRAGLHLSLALALALAAGCGMAHANPSILHVAIDTSGFGASSGYIDLQFGASVGGPLATADVTNIVGLDSAALIDSWGLTPLSGGYRFRNDTANDLFHAAQFGGTLYFDLAFAGDHDASGGFVSPFIVSAFDASYATLGTADPASGALATFFWTPSLIAGGSGSIGVSLSDAHVSLEPATHVSTVPEPATLYLVLCGLALIVLAARRRALSSERQATAIFSDDQ
jgi:hypothetical protein